MIEDGESVDSDDFLKVNNDNNGYQDSFSDSGSVGESFYANRQITSNFEDESLLEQSDFINREFSDYGQNPPFENQKNNSNGNIDLNDNSYGNDDLNTYNDNDLYGNSNLNPYNDDGLNNNDTNFHNEKDLFDNSENNGDILPNNLNRQGYENHLNGKENIEGSENLFNSNDGNFQNSESDFENSENGVDAFKNTIENKEGIFKDVNEKENTAGNENDNETFDKNSFAEINAETNGGALQNDDEEINNDYQFQSEDQDKDSINNNFLKDTRIAFQNKSENNDYNESENFENLQKANGLVDENIGDDEANSANEKSLAEQNSINTDTEIDDSQPKQSGVLSNRYSNNEDTEEKEENIERSFLSEEDLKEEKEREINSEIAETEKKTVAGHAESEKKTEAENDESQEETEEESDKSKDVESEDFETNDIKSERDKNQDPKDFEDYNDGKEEIKNRSININLTNQFLSNLSKAQSNEDVEQEQSMSSDAEIEKKGNKNVLGKYSDFLEGLKTQAGVTDKKEDNLDIESDDSEDDADNTENIQTEKEDLSESDELNFSESKVYDNSNAENKEDIENSVDEKREFEPKQEQQPFDPGAYLKNVINQNQNSENIEPKEEVKRTIFDDEDDEDIKSYNKEDIRKLLFDDEEEDEQEEIEKESYVQDIQKDKKEEQDKREEQVKQESQPFDASSYLKNLISSNQKEGKEEEPREQTPKTFERTAENPGNISKPVEENKEAEPESQKEQEDFDPGAYLKNVLSQNQNSEKSAPKEEVKRTIFDDEEEEDISSYSKEDIRKLLFDDEEEDEQEEVQRESNSEEESAENKKEVSKEQENQPFDASAYLKNLISSNQKEGKEEESEKQTPKIFERTAENAGNIANPVEEKMGAESEIKQEQQAFDPGAYLKNIINQNQNKEEKDSNNEIKKDNLFADLSQNNLSDNSESDIEDASDDEMISKMMFRKMGIEDTEDDDEDSGINVSDKKIGSSDIGNQKSSINNEITDKPDKERKPAGKTIFDDDYEEEPDKTLREDSFAEQLLRKMQAMRVEREQGKNNFDTNEARYNPLSEYGNGRNYSSRTNEKANNDDRTNFESKQEIKETVQEEPVKQSISQEIKSDSFKESETHKDDISLNADISSKTGADNLNTKSENNNGYAKAQPTEYSHSFVDNILTYGYGWDDVYSFNQEISDEEGLLNAFGVSNISYENGNANQQLSYDNNDPLKNIKKPEN